MSRRAPNKRLAIPSRAGAQKAIVILGMHRSGTSALCGALDLLGVDFGEHLMPANHANEKGYWEHEEIVRVHDELLSSLGSCWDDDMALPSDWVERERTREVRDLLIRILQRDFAQSALFGIKDPRMCRLMPLWFSIFQSLRVQPRFVLTVRHPWEVAESLAKRDRIEHPKSYLLWLEHVVQAEIATRNRERSLVRYEEMVRDPVAILGALRKQLRINFLDPTRVRARLRKFLDPSMRHHQLKRKDGQPVPKLTLDFYETIHNASTSREIASKAEPLVAEFIRARELFSPRIELVEAQLDSLAKELAKSEEARELLAALPAQLLELNRIGDEKAQQILLLQGKLKEQAQQVVLLQGELREQTEHVAFLKADLEEKSQRAAQVQAETEERAGRIVELQSEHEQQSEAFERLKKQLEISGDRLVHANLVQERLAAQARQSELATMPSLLENIDRIYDPPLLWKVVERLGLPGRAQAGAPRTAAERRALAKELKGAAEKIQKAISSRAISPEDAALAIERLHELGQQTRAILDSLRLRASKELIRTPPANPSLDKTSVAALFDAAWYLKQNPDIAAADMDPLEHYLRWGAREGRDPNPLFDTTWYLAKNPDVVASGLNPLQHYCERGAKEGRDPYPLFSTSWYLEANPNVRDDGISPLQHYLQHGARENRDPHPLFDSRWYVGENPAANGSNPLEHYRNWGARHGRSPHTLFDSAWYLAQCGDDAVAKSDPLRHYLEIGAGQGRDPHPLFDSSWYREQNPDLSSEMNPLRHYLERGAREGRDPHPLFQSKWYCEQNPAIVDSGVNPLQHYILHGAGDSRSPHPMFDSEYYRTTYLGTAEGRDNPLLHYLTIGARAGNWPNPTFDPVLYLQLHPDVAKTGLEPLTHYVLAGKGEGRAINHQELPPASFRPHFEIPREPALPVEQTVPDVKAIAFYLPQFHQIPENDAWWGHGFTEWSNVRRGVPNFQGHYQPHVPSELGYYDLAEPGIIEQQTRLARAAGIYGFCFYYYWFGGQTLLDLPIRRMLETGRPDFPFCLCWANENWTRRWDGLDKEILIAQRHSAEDDFAFIKKIEPVLRLENYIRVEGRPMLLVYRPSKLPAASVTLDRWRKHFREAGLGELHIVMVRSFSEQASAESYGFDAAVQFPPHFPVDPVTALISGRNENFSGHIYEYDEVRRSALEQLSSASQSRLYPGVMPSWDNTARQRTGSSIWVNSSPEAYYEWLAESVRIAGVKLASSERFLFINAWNEWAEGCHLEPDERFGYAWLNATSRALREPLPAPYPQPPVDRRIKVEPLKGPIRLVLSVLLYHREDLILGLLRSLLPQMLSASSGPELTCELFLSFNYNPSPGVVDKLRQVVSEILPNPDSVHIVENGFNLGFGAGHNAIFEKAESDIFVILNSDLQIGDNDWLEKFTERFRTSDAAMVGLAENASRLREDGCGVLVQDKGAAFDFVDGSVLAVRSDVASRVGFFSPSFDYFYFEDVDLNLRYRQMGLRIDVLDIACTHARSSSAQLLPRYAVESVLDRNRTRFFERWGKYLATRKLSNRLAVNFRDADRQLQCASLPAIFGLLDEHPTATLDLRGVHEQLVSLFKHERIRLIPHWQTLRDQDYLRSYELGHDSSIERPRAIEIAEQMLVEPGFQQARSHLEALVPTCSTIRGRPGRALIYVARQEVLFEGRQPDPLGLLGVQEILREKSFDVQFYSEYGAHELKAATKEQKQNWKYVSGTSGLDFLRDLVRADLLVTSDGWAAELGQLLNKKTFVWMGATSGASLIWNAVHAAAFADFTLDCLGCHHRFGKTARNICLRGDIACMRTNLANRFAEALERFIKGENVNVDHGKPPVVAPVIKRLRRSEQGMLDAWPETSAESVLILTPTNPALDPAVIRRARELAERAISGMRGCRIVYDETGEAPLRGKPHPQRQAAIAKIRQNMIDRHLRDERWVFWVDADVVGYPANLVEELLSRAEGGIAAPLVLMEGDLSEPAYSAGFGPGRFYDIAGFVEKGRWARFTQPYFNQIGPVYRLDSVGSCYLINADLYRAGAKHTVDYATNSFISSKSEWSADAIHKNQAGDANSYTEHYSVCEFAREAGLPVRAFADLIAFHQKA